MTNKTKRNAGLLNTSSLFVLGTASVLLGSGPAQAFDANSLPTGGNVTGGSATIATSGNTLTVNQSSNRAIIDWRGFNIGANAQANFVQPGTSSIAVNRVNGSTDPSRIDGGLHANGQVWVLNPNGVFFGKTARVDAAGVVATTANINDKAFMAGSNKLQMTGGDSGQVVNEGHISVGEGGLAAFVAPSVRNSGTIRARVGKVTLAAGDTYTLDLAGDRLVEIGLGSNKAVVDQSGKIINAGGVIDISAKAAGQVVDAVINTSGVTDASSVRSVGGKIVLGADVINVASDASLKADGTSGGQITAVANKTGTYAGSYSAQGTTGDGGQIETSGHAVHVDNKIAVNTTSAKGKTGSWKIDPTDLVIDGSNVAGYENNLDSTNVDISASNSITVNTAFDTSSQTNANTLNLKDEDANGALTINLNAGIKLGGNQHLTGDGSIVNVSSAGLIQNGVDAALNSGSIVNVAAGVYAPNVTINKSGLSLLGASDAEIDVNPGSGALNAINIAGGTNGVTVSGFKIRGEITDSYIFHNFGSGVSRGIAIGSGATNFTVSNNDIRNVRNGILLDGAPNLSSSPNNTGSITGNVIDNTKSALSINYTDGSGVSITGNSQGSNGNEWGEIWHLQGAHTGAASGGVQTALLAASSANSGWTVQDLAYASSNRTAVTVAATGGSDSNQGTPRAALASIGAGINAVVTGGTVNVKDGTYTIPSGGGNYLDITKAMTLKGQSEAGTIIDASNASTYGLRVQADNVALANFTLKGPTSSGGYGIKVEPLELVIAPTDRVNNFSIAHVTETGSYKNGLDLNGVASGTIDHVTVSGTTHGTGIALTDSANVTLTNNTTTGNAWGGLALYQHNATYNQQTTGISVDASNSFGEANGVYMEDESTSKDFGTVTVNGYDHAVKATVAPNDSYTWLQNGEQTAINFAVASAPTTASVQGWTGSAGDATFVVGDGLKIQSALNAAKSGATVNVQAGTYNEALSITTAGLTLHSVDPRGAIINAGGADYGIDIASNAGNLGTLTVDGFRVEGWASVGINQSRAAGPFASLQVTNNLVYGPPGGATAHGNGIEVSGDGSVVRGNEVHLVHLNSPTWSGSGIIVANSSNVIVDSNIVDGADTAIAVTSYDHTAAMTGIAITNNQISNSVYEGISIQAYEGDYFGTPSGPITGLTITGNKVTNSVSALGIWDYSGGSAVWTGTLTNVSDNTFNGNAYQISTDFTGADVKPLVTLNHFDASVINDAGSNTIYGDLQTAIDNEAAGSTLNLAGTFAAGASINQHDMVLNGNHEAVINVSAGTTGLKVNADNVTVEGIEFAGPVSGDYNTLTWTEPSSSGTGIVVTGNDHSGVNNFKISDNNIHHVRTGIIVQGTSATGAITGNTVENTKGGILIQYNDGTPYTISGNGEGAVGNEWGIVVNLNTSGINTPGAAPLSAQQNLLALANTNGGMSAMDRHYAEANRTRVVVDATSTATAADDGGHGNGLGNARQPLSTIQAGVDAVVNGGIINVKDGAYTLANELDINKSLTLKGQSEAGTVITADPAYTGYGIFVDADAVTLSNFTFNPSAAGSYGIKVQPNSGDPAARLNDFAIDHVTIAGSHKTGLDLNGVTGATIDNVTVTGTTAGNGIALTDSADVAITNTTTSGNAWGGLALYQTNSTYDQQVNNVSVDGNSSFAEANGIYAQDQSAASDFGSIDLSAQGLQYVAQLVAPAASGDGTYSFFQKTQQSAVDIASAFNTRYSIKDGTVQGYGGTGVNGDNHFTVGTDSNGVALSVNAALDASTTGGVIDVLNGTYAEAVSVAAPLTVNFDNVTLNSLAITQTGSGSTLSGSVNTGSVTGFAINLGGDLSLDTSAAGGTIALANVDGAHDLALNAGTGAVLVGGLGATTRLGAVDITADLIGLGATNKAASFDFNGDVALLATSTVIDTTVSNTAAGDITFAGDIFGFTDGGQSLTLAAGPGTGAKSANGDIAMNNAGLSTLRLGSMTVSGDDFTALTVDLAGGFTSQLTGNQLFAADTLNAAGDVNSNVAGNIGGHIVSGGNVTLTAAGGVSGDITGKVVSLTGQTVNSQVTANTLNVNAAQGGTITGTFTPGTVSNGLVVNGTTVGSNTGTGNAGTGNTGTGNTGTGNTGTGNTGTGNTGTGNTGTGNTGTGNTGTGNTANNFPNVNLQQLVVEGFALPVGTQIGANGQLILPAGTVLGLLSPGGGTPRVIMVQTVQELGALLDQGYSAIVIDLTGHKKATKVASN